MGIAILAFVAIFLLIASAGMLLFYREAMLQRVEQVVTPRPESGGWRRLFGRNGHSIGGVVRQFERVLPRSPSEVSKTGKRLIRAGFRQESAVDIYFGAKVLVPIVLCFLVLISGLGRHNTFFVYTVALALGFMAPDFWVGRRISLRHNKLRLGLPDALDMLVNCI
jgi:tight adherence protein C